MNIKKGDTISTSLFDKTIVLDIEGKRATLFTGSQFVVAGGIEFNEEKGFFEWQAGRYVDSIDKLVLAQVDDLTMMKNLLSGLIDNNYEDFVKALISIESGIENEETLENVYDNYMNDDSMGLLDNNFAKYIDDYSLESEQTPRSIINENNKVKVKENIIYENKEKDTESITGNLTADPKVSQHTTKDGRAFKVAAFSIANNDKEGNVKFTKCYAYDNKIEKVDNLKKGDFVSLLGKAQVFQSKDGKNYESFKVYGVKVLKEKRKESIIGNMNKYKDKAKLDNKGNRRSQNQIEKDNEI